MKFKETKPTTLIKVPTAVTIASFHHIHAQIEGCGDIISEEMYKNQNDLLYWVRDQEKKMGRERVALEKEFAEHEFVVAMKAKIKKVKQLEEKIAATGWLVKNRMGAYQEEQINKEYQTQKQALEKDEPYYPPGRFRSSLLGDPITNWIVEEVYDPAQIPAMFHCTEPQMEGRDSASFRDSKTKKVTNICDKVRKRLNHFAQQHDGLEDVPGVTFRKKVTMHYSIHPKASIASKKDIEKLKRIKTEAIDRVTDQRSQQVEKVKEICNKGYHT